MLANPQFLRDRPEMFCDPLSDALDLINAESAVSGTLLAGGAWNIRFPRPGKIKFNAVVKGSAWLVLDDAGLEPIRLGAPIPSSSPAISPRPSWRPSIFSAKRSVGPPASATPMNIMRSADTCPSMRPASICCSTACRR